MELIESAFLDDIMTKSQSTVQFQIHLRDLLQ